MAKKVNITCAHCGDSTTKVHKSHGIKGVPATLEAAAEQGHKESAMHGLNTAASGLMGLSLYGNTSKAESVTGKLDDFTHGKEHNA